VARVGPLRFIGSGVKVVGRYLELTRAIRYERNELNEGIVPHEKNSREGVRKNTKEYPAPLEQSEGVPYSFVLSTDLTPRKIPSQTLPSFNSFLSYPKAFPDLSPDHHRILERAQVRGCCFLIDFMTNSSFEHLTATQHAVDELLSLGLLERTQNGRKRTSVYSLSRYEFNELKYSDDKSPAPAELEVCGMYAKEPVALIAQPLPTLGLVACFEQPIHVHKLMAALERAHIPSDYSRTDDPLPHQLSSTHPDAFSVAKSLNITYCSLEAL